MEHRRNTVASCLRERNIAVEESAPIGKGAYGKVFRGVLNKRAVAIKRMMYCPKATNGVPLASLREMAAGLHLSPDCTTLMRLLDWAQENHIHESSIYLVYEMMNCDLSTFMKNQLKGQDLKAAKLSEHLIQHFSRQLLQGIDFMHINRMVHRDIKPDNILIDHLLQLKIADFGLTHASGFEGSRTPEVVTLWYRAPEILVRREYGSMCDVWAAGLIICEMNELRPLVIGNKEIDVIRNILRFVGKDDSFECPVKCWEDLVLTSDLPLVSNLRRRLSSRDEDFISLVIDLLAFNPDLRPTAEEALARMFFRKKYQQGLPVRMVERVIVQEDESSGSELESDRESECDSSATESCEPDHDTDTYHRYSSDDFGVNDGPSTPSSDDHYPAEADNVNDSWDGSDILRKIDLGNIASAVSGDLTDGEEEPVPEPRMQLVRLSEEIEANMNRVSNFTRSYPAAQSAWNSPPASSRPQRYSMPAQSLVIDEPLPQFDPQPRSATFSRVPGAERARSRAVPSRRLSMPANPAADLEPMLRRLDIPGDLGRIREDEEAGAVAGSMLEIGSEVEVRSSCRGSFRFSPFDPPPGPSHNVDLDASDEEPVPVHLLPRDLAEHLEITTLRQDAPLPLSALPIMPRRSMDPSRKRLVIREPRLEEFSRPPKARRSTPCMPWIDVADPFGIRRGGGNEASSPGCNTNTSFGENTLRAALDECDPAMNRHEDLDAASDGNEDDDDNEDPDAASDGEREEEEDHLSSGGSSEDHVSECEEAENHLTKLLPPGSSSEANVKRWLKNLKHAEEDKHPDE